MNVIARRDFIKLGFSAVLSCAGAGQSFGSGAEEIFTDRTADAGIDFFHFNGMAGSRYYPEVTGSGVPLFDYNNDGDLDIFFVQGAFLDPNQDPQHTVFPPRMPLRGKLYRNDSIHNPDGAVTLKFTDVTEQSGIRAFGYGMGVAAGNFNNDGWVDLYITNFGHNQLWRNNGDGTFTDVTSQSGTDVLGWSSSASFVDFDRDGWLDLRPNQLWINQHDGTFKDEALTLGCALNRDGGPHSSMGIDAGDLFGRSQEDVVITNLAGQYAYIYGNGKDGFEDRSYETGIAMATRRYTGFGVAMLDYDNDGGNTLWSSIGPRRMHSRA